MTIQSRNLTSYACFAFCFYLYFFNRPLTAQNTVYPPGTPHPVLATIPCYLTETHNYPTTVANTPVSATNPRACFITIDRNTPGSPLPIVVPKNTTVQVEVTNSSNLEATQFVTVNDAIPAPDFFKALGTALLPGISVITLKARDTNSGGETFEDREQAAALQTITTVSTQLDRAYVQLTCLQKQVSYDPANFRCTQQKLTTASELDNSKTAVVQSLTLASKAALPIGRLKALDGQISKMIDDCNRAGGSDQTRNDCLADPVRLQDQQANLNSALARAQTKQVAAATAGDALRAIPGAGTYVYVLSPSPDHKATVVITAKDGISGNTTALGTVVVSWQGTNFSISSGLLVSTMRNRTYANGPVIVNGVPTTTTTTSSTGTTTTTVNMMVTESDTRPSFVTPLVFVNYEFGSWCSGKCGFIVSAGLGANLTTKTADYAAGPSWRYRDAIFTPSLHIGRETFPTNGITVGDTQLTGTTVPTEMDYKAHFGFAVTYRLPIP